MDGQQPRNTHVMRNYVHEFGHYQKQSSMWSNNKACLAQVEGNIVFNGPRVNCQPLCPLPVLVRWSSALTLFRCVVFCGTLGRDQLQRATTLSNPLCCRLSPVLNMEGLCNRTGLVAART